MMDVEAYHIVTNVSTSDKVTFFPFSQVLTYLDVTRVSIAKRLRLSTIHIFKIPHVSSQLPSRIGKKKVEIKKNKNDWMFNCCYILGLERKRTRSHWQWRHESTEQIWTSHPTTKWVLAGIRPCSRCGGHQTRSGYWIQVRKAQYWIVWWVHLRYRAILIFVIVTDASLLILEHNLLYHL